MLMFCATVSAQTSDPQTITDDVRVVEELDNGRGYIVKIYGVEFRAVDAERWRELQIAKVKADASADIDKLNAEQVKQLLAYIAALEKRSDTDAKQIATLTQMLNDYQAQIAARGKQTKLGFVKEVIGAGWQIFTWWRAVQ